MKKNALFGMGLTAAAVGLAASLVTAQNGGVGGRRSGLDQQVGQQGRGRPGPVGRMGPGGRFGGVFAGLNLSEEQRAKVAGIQRASHEQAAPIEEELRAVRKALHAELFADAREAGKVEDLSAKVASLQKQLGDLHIQTTASVSDLLTAEQRATVRAREGRAGGPGRGAGRFAYGRRR